MEDFLTDSLVDLGERLRAGSLSAVELCEAVLARIEATHEDLNAFCSLREREAILADARASDARISRGEARPLEGIPLGVKELEAAEGLPHTEGCLIFKDRVAEGDSTQVARLRAAGAIVVGKTNAPEFGATAITKNLVYGVTRSPWNLEHTPGGSSGGSAAALAGGVCPLVTSSDGGGSIRIPASFVGAFGLKTSFGRVPKGPFHEWSYGDTAVYGPTTRTVADAALFLDQVVGASPVDPNSLPHPGLSYQESLAEALPRGTRFGVSVDLGYAVVQSDVGACFEEAIQVFEEAGHTLVPIEGGPPKMGREWGMLGAFELASELREHLPEREDDIGRSLMQSIRMGAGMTPEIWGQAAAQREKVNHWCAEVFDQVDFLLTPTVPYDPPPARGPFPTETEGRRQVAAGVAAFTIPFNLSWHPASSQRAGLSQAGLPIGLQIVGPRHRDDLVLRASKLFEEAVPAHPHWPTSW